MKQLLIKFVLTLCLPLFGGHALTVAHTDAARHAQWNRIENPGHTQKSSEKIRAVEVEEDDDVEQACKLPESTIDFFTYHYIQPAAHTHRLFASSLSGAHLHSFNPTPKCILHSVFRI